MKVINPIQIINPELYDTGTRARMGLNMGAEQGKGQLSTQYIIISSPE
jgi:hypothetical protein